MNTTAPPDSCFTRLDQWRALLLHGGRIADHFHGTRGVPCEWRVFRNAAGVLCAGPAHLPPTHLGPPPAFPPWPTLSPCTCPQDYNFGWDRCYFRTDDGWLIARNWGDYGGDLHWSSDDGSCTCKISNHQVVGFRRHPEGVTAIESQVQGDLSWSSVIRMVPPPEGGRWTAVEVGPLPSPPLALSVRRDGTLVITLQDKIVAMDADGQIRTLCEVSPGTLISVHSSELSDDESLLYIGMLQAVAEVHLSSGGVRHLAPPEAVFRN